MNVTMTKRLLVLLLLAGLPLLAGCPASRYFAYLLFGGQEKPVKAEFTGLKGKSVAVVVFCDKRTQYDYPDISLTLASAIAGELEKHVEKVRVIDPRQVVKYQDSNIYWDEMGKTELGKALGADFLLFVPLEEFSTRETGSQNLYRGRITSQCGLWQVSLPERKARVWQSETIRVVHPEHDPSGLLQENDRVVREKTERLFADRLAKKFYDHKVPLE